MYLFDIVTEWSALDRTTAIECVFVGSNLNYLLVISTTVAAVIASRSVCRSVVGGSLRAYCGRLSCRVCWTDADEETEISSLAGPVDAGEVEVVEEKEEEDDDGVCII